MQGRETVWFVLVSSVRACVREGAAVAARLAAGYDHDQTLSKRGLGLS